MTSGLGQAGSPVPAARSGGRRDSAAVISRQQQRQRPRAGAGAAATAALAIGLITAGCGTAPAPTSPAARPAARPAAGTAACARSQLRIAVDVHAAGVAAGTAYLPLTFVNVSARPCLLTGYPQVEPASGQSGHQVGGIAAADRTLTAHALRIAAGGTAHAWLRLVSVGNLPAAQCHPVTAPGLLVTVPGQAEGSFVRFPVQTCAKPERAAAVLTVDPFQPGPARKGSAP